MITNETKQLHLRQGQHYSCLLSRKNIWQTVHSNISLYIEGARNIVNEVSHSSTFLLAMVLGKRMHTTFRAVFLADVPELLKAHNTSQVCRVDFYALFLKTFLEISFLHSLLPRGFKLFSKNKDKIKTIS